MQVAVIGATGRTGRHVVALLGQRGHSVVVLARDPQRLPPVPPGTRIVRGSGRVEHDAHRSPRRSSIGRTDLAAFLVDQLSDPRYVGQAPLVATGR